MRTPTIRKYSKETRSWFEAFMSGDEKRANNLLAGEQAITYTEGQPGGYIVPQEFFEQVVLGLAQVDPLLDENVVSLIRGKGNLRPIAIPGWNLSTFEAVLISEANQQTPQTVPPATSVQLGGWKYGAALAASFELEEDMFDVLLNQMREAYSIAFARAIGVALTTGSGDNSPAGILTCCEADYDPVYSTSATILELDDFTKLYFAVNRYARKSPKCAWLMADSTYQLARQAVDSEGRPLINIVDDEERILGKPVLISPSMPAWETSPSSVGAGAIVFGDFSKFFVRCSDMQLRRTLQSGADGGYGNVEYGQATYRAWMRADSTLQDPALNAFAFMRQAERKERQTKMAKSIFDRNPNPGVYLTGLIPAIPSSPGPVTPVKQNWTPPALKPYSTRPADPPTNPQPDRLGESPLVAPKKGGSVLDCSDISVSSPVPFADGPAPGILGVPGLGIPPAGKEGAAAHDALNNNTTIIKL
jgi:HK97 family phage major capsid protein